MDNVALNNIYNDLLEDGLVKSDTTFNAWKSNFKKDDQVKANVHNYLVKNKKIENTSYKEWTNNVMPDTEGKTSLSKAILSPIQGFKLMGETYLSIPSRAVSWYRQRQADRSNYGTGIHPDEVQNKQYEKDAAEMGHGLYFNPENQGFGADHSPYHSPYQALTDEQREEFLNVSPGMKLNEETGQWEQTRDRNQIPTGRKIFRNVSEFWDSDNEERLGAISAFIGKYKDNIFSDKLDNVFDGDLTKQYDHILEQGKNAKLLKTEDQRLLDLDGKISIEEDPEIKTKLQKERQKLADELGYVKLFDDREFIDGKKNPNFNKPIGWIEKNVEDEANKLQEQNSGEISTLQSLYRDRYYSLVANMKILTEGEELNKQRKILNGIPVEVYAVGEGVESTYARQRYTKKRADDLVKEGINEKQIQEFLNYLDEYETKHGSTYKTYELVKKAGRDPIDSDWTIKNYSLDEVRQNPERFAAEHIGSQEYEEWLDRGEYKLRTGVADNLQFHNVSHWVTKDGKYIHGHLDETLQRIAEGSANGDLVEGLRALPGESMYAKQFNDALFQFKVINRALQINTDLSKLEQQNIIKETVLRGKSAEYWGTNKINDDYAEAFTNSMESVGYEMKPGLGGRADDSILNAITPDRVFGLDVRQVLEGGAMVTKDLVPLIASIAITRRATAAQVEAVSLRLGNWLKAGKYGKKAKNFIDIGLGAATETFYLAGADIVGEEIIEPLTGINIHPIVINTDKGTFTPTFAAALGAANVMTSKITQAVLAYDNAALQKTLTLLGQSEMVSLMGRGSLTATAGTTSMYFAEKVSLNLDYLMKEGSLYTEAGIENKYLKMGYNPDEAKEMALKEYKSHFGNQKLAETWIGMFMLQTLPNQNNVWGFSGDFVKAMKSDVLAINGSTLISKAASKTLGVPENSTSDTINTAKMTKISEINKSNMSGKEKREAIEKIEEAAKELEFLNDLKDAKDAVKQHDNWLAEIAEANFLGKKILSGEKLTGDQIKRLEKLSPAQKEIIRTNLKIAKGSKQAEYLQETFEIYSDMVNHVRFGDNVYEGKQQSKILELRQEWMMLQGELSQIQSVTTGAKEGVPFRRPNTMTPQPGRQSVTYKTAGGAGRARKIKERQKEIEEAIEVQKKEYDSTGREKIKDYGKLMELQRKAFGVKEGDWKQVNNEQMVDILMQTGMSRKQAIANAPFHNAVRVGNKIFQNVDASIKRGEFGSGQHDVLHHVLRNSFKEKEFLSNGEPNPKFELITKDGMRAIRAFKELIRLYHGEKAIKDLEQFVEEVYGREDKFFDKESYENYKRQLLDLGYDPKAQFKRDYKESLESIDKKMDALKRGEHYFVKKRPEVYYEEYLNKYFDALSPEGTAGGAVKINYKAGGKEMLTDFVVPFVRKIPGMENYKRGNRYSTETGKELFDLVRGFYKMSKEAFELIEKGREKDVYLDPGIVDLGKVGKATKAESKAIIQRYDASKSKPKSLAEYNERINSYGRKHDGTRFKNKEEFREGEYSQKIYDATMAEQRKRAKNDPEFTKNEEQMKEEAMMEAQRGYTRSHMELFGSYKKTGKLDATILSYLEKGSTNVFGKPIEKFIEDVKVEAEKEFNNYDPAKNEHVFGYMNYIVSLKAPGVFARYKAEEFIKQVDPTKAPDRYNPLRDLAVEGKTPESILIAKEQREARLKTAEMTNFRRSIQSYDGKKGVNQEFINNLKTSALKKWMYRLKDPKKSKEFRADIEKHFKENPELYKYITENLMGKGEQYKAFIRNNTETLKKFITNENWVKYERKVPREERILTEVEIENMSVEQTKAAIDAGRVPDTTSLTAGNTLWRANKNLTWQQLWDFLNAPSINPKTGKKSNTKGNRKTELAKDILSEMSFDMSMEVSQSAEVRQRQKDIAEIDGIQPAKNFVELVSTALRRNPDMKFSKSVERYASKQQRQVFWWKRSQLLNEIWESGEFSSQAINRKIREIYGIVKDRNGNSLNSKIAQEYAVIFGKAAAREKLYKEANVEFPTIDEIFMKIAEEPAPEAMLKIMKIFDVKSGIDLFRDKPTDNVVGGARVESRRKHQRDILTEQMERRSKEIYKKEFDNLTPKQKEAIKEKATVDAIRTKGYIENGSQSPGRAMIFYKTEGFAKNYLSTIWGKDLVNYTQTAATTKRGGKYTLEFKDGSTKELNMPESAKYDTKQEVTKEMLEGIEYWKTKEGIKEKKLRKESAEFMWDQMIESYDIASKLCKDPMTQYGKTEMAMFNIGMLGNMKTPARAAALFEYIPLDPITTKLKREVYDPKKGEYVMKKNFEYEHGIVAKKLVEVLNAHFFGGQKVNLEALKDSYRTGAIHVNFNKNFSQWFGDRMQFGYRVGDIAPKRWFNMLTEYGESHAVQSIYTYEIFGQSQAAKWKQIQANNLKLNKRNKKLAVQAGIVHSKSNKKAIENLKTVDKALALGKLARKEKRGISVWDFDDTLARTKSGVLATIPNPSGKPMPKRKVIFLAGGPGSGKSTIVKNLGLEKQGFKVVNQDISLQWLAKNHGLPKDMREFTQEQASKWGELTWQARDIMKRKKTKFQGKGDGIIVDGTGASKASMQQQVMEFKNKGYDVSMVFVETSLPIALARNKARKERSLRDSIVERTWSSVMKNKNTFIEMFGENFIEINTSRLKINDPIPPDAIAKMDLFTKSYEKKRLTAEEFAGRGKEILDRGGKFDFSEFKFVREGKPGPFFEKFVKRMKKYGPEDNFILTARPPESAPHIHMWLRMEGYEIPLKNIAALGNSTAAAKALWMLRKFEQGYNDFYFADDALANVKEVKNVLDQLDVKSKVQQAIQFSKSGLSKNFNKIVEETTGLKAEYEISGTKAELLGRAKGARSIIVPGAQDFMGLMQNFMGKGKKGEAHQKFFEDNLVKPFAKGTNDLNNVKQRVAEDFKALTKQFPTAKKNLTKKIPGSVYTYEQAIRVHRWTESGYKIPEISKTDVKFLNETVRKDVDLLNFSNKLDVLSKGEYIQPKAHWITERIISDLQKMTQYEGRKKYLAEWIENKDIIFSPENMNKIEATQGKKFREALEDMLYRMETGSNRPTGSNRLANAHMNFINGSVGATMFLNMRSALLQTISATNFINWTDNNPLKAAASFANQRQYWKDFTMIWNSPMLKQRRAGLKYNVQEAEIAAAVQGSTNKAKAAIAWLLKKGFTPTQIADSFAISAGGATFYRNRVKTYERQGLSPKEARKKAFLDFQETSEKAQQSSRADLISQQQASVLGRTILAWANTPMQYMRIQEKAARDLINGRGDAKTHISKITYYGAIQSLIFASLQSALFSFGLDEDDEKDLGDEQLTERLIRVLNTVADSQLRGIGTPGALLSAIKNTVMEFDKQEEKGYRADHTRTILQLTSYSPVIGSKLRKLYSATQTYKYNRDVISDMGLDIDNPANLAIANTIEATTNIPLARVVMKIDNLREAADDRNQWWQRIASLLGWAKWDVGVRNERLERRKEIIKEKKKEEKKKKSKSEKKGRCTAITTTGRRCKNSVKNNKRCYLH